MKKERLEDLGILSERLDQILGGEFLQYCVSKHEFDSWQKQFDEEDKSLGIESSESDRIYDIHCKLRWLRQKIEECYWIAHGDSE